MKREVRLEPPHRGTMGFSKTGNLEIFADFSALSGMDWKSLYAIRGIQFCRDAAGSDRVDIESVPLRPPLIENPQGQRGRLNISWLVSGSDGPFHEEETKFSQKKVFRWASP